MVREANVEVKRGAREREREREIQITFWVFRLFIIVLLWCFSAFLQYMKYNDDLRRMFLQ